MPRDFAAEPWIRTYTTDTKGWLLLGWRGQTVWSLLYRKAAPLGVLILEGVQPWELGMLRCSIPEEVARPGMERCLETGWIQHDDDRVVFPRFEEANSAAMTSTQRSRVHRLREQARRTELQRNVAELCNAPLPHEGTFRDGLQRNVTVGNAALLAVVEDVPELASTAAAWLSRATGLEPFPATRRWRDSLIMIGQKPDDQKRLAAGVLQREATRGMDVARMLNPEHVINYWHFYGVGKAPGKQAPIARELTELEKLREQWRQLEIRERACLFNEGALRTKLQAQMEEISARVKALTQGGSNGRV